MPRRLITALVTLVLGLAIGLVGHALHFSGQAYFVAFLIGGLLISFTDPHRFGWRY